MVDPFAPQPNALAEADAILHPSGAVEDRPRGVGAQVSLVVVAALALLAAGLRIRAQVRAALGSGAGTVAATGSDVGKGA